MTQQMARKGRRLFFALWPAASLQRSIAEQTRPMLAPCGGRLLEIEKLHITLAYFGLADETTRACLEEAAGQIESPSFRLSLSHLDYWFRPRVAWLGPVSIPAELNGLVRLFNERLEPCGYTPEHYPYVPHMTLVRKAKRAPAESEIAPIEWGVERFALVESVSVERGVRYAVLKQWPLIEE